MSGHIEGLKQHEVKSCDTLYLPWNTPGAVFFIYMFKLCRQCFKWYVMWSGNLAESNLCCDISISGYYKVVVYSSHLTKLLAVIWCSNNYLFNCTVFGQFITWLYCMICTVQSCGWWVIRILKIQCVTSLWSSHVKYNIYMYCMFAVPWSKGDRIFITWVQGWAEDKCNYYDIVQVFGV